MKKLAFLFVAASAISFASCGNGTKANETAVDSDSVVVDTTVEVVDSLAADSVVATDSVAQ